MKKGWQWLFGILVMSLSMHVFAQAKVVHVVVALCDNKYQGIVPVPAKIGNGQDPENNLYWGAAYGVKTFMKKQNNWTLLSSTKNPRAPILERLVFKNKAQDVYLVADAYDGKYIKDATQDFFNYSAGTDKNNINRLSINKQNITAGSNADLVVYIGHNGLMDFSMNAANVADKQSNQQRKAAVFACKSQQYYSPELAKTGIQPLVMTTNFMAPEAYTLNALLNGYLKGESSAQVKERVAQSYHQYQKCGIKGARALFSTK